MVLIGGDELILPVLRVHPRSELVAGETALVVEHKLGLASVQVLRGPMLKCANHDFGCGRLDREHPHVRCSGIDEPEQILASRPNVT